MAEPVELARSLRASYEQALDVIDGESRTREPLGDQVVAAVTELAAERDRLRALIKDARDARDPTITAGLPSEELGAGVRSYLEAVDRLLAEGVDGDEHFASLYESGESVFAERDRLRAELADEKCNGQSTEGAYHDARAERDRLAMSLEEEQELHGETRAERDRLRAVAEAAHEVLAGLDWTTGGGKKLIPVTALSVLRDRLAQLDASGVMGGGKGQT